jgi:isopropylmalate/homocitrate/citramalate synthase
VLGKLNIAHKLDELGVHFIEGGWPGSNPKKVRILEESVGTESHVRVLIKSSDGLTEWRAVVSSTHIIEASWLALADSLKHCLLRQIAGVPIFSV